MRTHYWNPIGEPVTQLFRPNFVKVGRHWICFLQLEKLSLPVRHILIIGTFSLWYRTCTEVMSNIPLPSVAYSLSLGYVHLKNELEWELVSKRLTEFGTRATSVIANNVYQSSSVVLQVKISMINFTYISNFISNEVHQKLSKLGWSSSKAFEISSTHAPVEYYHFNGFLGLSILGIAWVPVSNLTIYCINFKR